MDDQMKTSKEKGLSFIEILLIFGLIGIMAAIAIPSLVGQFPKYRLNGAARQIMADLMWARMQSLNRNNQFVVSFPDTHLYTILDDANNDGSTTTGESLQTKDIQADYHDVTMSVTANPIFYPNGLSSGTIVTLSNSSGTKLIRVNIAGHIKIE